MHRDMMFLASNSLHNLRGQKCFQQGKFATNSLKYGMYGLTAKLSVPWLIICQIFMKWCPIFDSSPLIQNSKFNNFLWVCLFLCKNLSNFLHNPYSHIVHWKNVARKLPQFHENCNKSQAHGLRTPNKVFLHWNPEL